MTYHKKLKQCLYAENLYKIEIIFQFLKASLYNPKNKLNNISLEHFVKQLICLVLIVLFTVIEAKQMLSSVLIILLLYFP